MTVEIKNFDTPDEFRPFAAHGHADVVDVDGRTVLRGTFEPGWTWSGDVKPLAGTELCEVAHLNCILSGSMRVHMADGESFEMQAGDVATIPPGHDAEVLGDEPCVALDFGATSEYAKER